MHTVLVIAAGLMLLGLFLLPAQVLRRPALRPRAASWFVVAWFVCAAANMWVGVTRAGYSISDELPVFVVVFAVPAAVALLLRRLWR
jgi:hypothetical protein